MSTPIRPRKKPMMPPQLPKAKPSTFQIVSNTDPAADVIAMRYNGGKNHMNNTQAGQEGSLGNPYKWSGNGGTGTVEEAVARFKKDFLSRVENDTEYRDYILSLAGKKIGYYKPDAKTPTHLKVIKEWLEQQSAAPQAAAATATTESAANRLTQIITDLARTHPELDSHLERNAMRGFKVSGTNKYQGKPVFTATNVADPTTSAILQKILNAKKHGLEDEEIVAVQNFIQANDFNTAYRNALRFSGENKKVPIFSGKIAQELGDLNQVDPSVVEAAIKAVMNKNNAANKNFPSYAEALRMTKDRRTGQVDPSRILVSPGVLHNARLEIMYKLRDQALTKRISKDMGVSAPTFKGNEGQAKKAKQKVLDQRYPEGDSRRVFTPEEEEALIGPLTERNTSLTYGDELKRNNPKDAEGSQTLFDSIEEEIQASQRPGYQASPDPDTTLKEQRDRKTGAEVGFNSIGQQFQKFEAVVPAKAKAGQRDPSEIIPKHIAEYLPGLKIEHGEPQPGQAPQTLVSWKGQEPVTIDEAMSLLKDEPYVEKYLKTVKMFSDTEKQLPSAEGGRLASDAIVRKLAKDKEYSDDGSGHSATNKEDIAEALSENRTSQEEAETLAKKRTARFGGRADAPRKQGTLSREQLEENRAAILAGEIKGKSLTVGGLKKSKDFILPPNHKNASPGQVSYLTGLLDDPSNPAQAQILKEIAAQPYAKGQTPETIVEHLQATDAYGMSSADASGWLQRLKEASPSDSPSALKVGEPGPGQTKAQWSNPRRRDQFRREVLGTVRTKGIQEQTALELAHQTKEKLYTFLDSLPDKDTATAAREVKALLLDMQRSSNIPKGEAVEAVFKGLEASNREDVINELRLRKLLSSGVKKAAKRQNVPKGKVVDQNATPFGVSKLTTEERVDHKRLNPAPDPYIGQDREIKSEFTGKSQIPTSRRQDKERVVEVKGIPRRLAAQATDKPVGSGPERAKTPITPAPTEGLKGKPKKFEDVDTTRQNIRLTPYVVKTALDNAKKIFDAEVAKAGGMEAWIKKNPLPKKGVGGKPETKLKELVEKNLIKLRAEARELDAKTPGHSEPIRKTGNVSYERSDEPGVKRYLAGKETYDANRRYYTQGKPEREAKVTPAEEAKEFSDNPLMELLSYTTTPGHLDRGTLRYGDRRIVAISKQRKKAVSKTGRSGTVSGPRKPKSRNMTGSPRKLRESDYSPAAWAKMKKQGVDNPLFWYTNMIEGS